MPLKLDRSGLVPGIRDKRRFDHVQGGWVYIVTNKPNGTFYVGVTSDLSRRAFEHREGLVAGFTRRYELKWLIYFERYDDIRHAVQRERTMKH